MTRRALIGHTGFVGSNMRGLSSYTDLYNSSNFELMRGETYDQVVCSGISAVKWLANKEPEQDWAGIQRLLDVLATVEARRFILISTIDVYPDPSSGLDEKADLGGRENHAYGRHRLAVERWVAERFSNHMIVRLPALFGPGLKKNALYDLLNDNGVEKINPAAAFQWYPLPRLGDDIARAEAAGLRLVNLFTAPVLMSDIIDRFFPGANVGKAALPAPSYNLRTCHAEVFGGRGGYIMDSEQVMLALSQFVEVSRRDQASAA